MSLWKRLKVLWWLTDNVVGPVDGKVIVGASLFKKNQQAKIVETQDVFEKLNNIDLE